MLPKVVRQLLAELELLSHGATQSWNSAGGRGESEAELPFGELNPPHITLRILYLKQMSDTGRLAVIARMEAVRDAARGHVDRSHVVGESREQEDHRIVKQGTGFTADEVARQFNCTATRVRKARLAAGRSPLDGSATKVSDAMETAKERARRMKSDGYTERQIATILDQKKSTVHDWVKAA